MIQNRKNFLSNNEFDEGHDEDNRMDCQSAAYDMCFITDPLGGSNAWRTSVKGNKFLERHGVNTDTSFVDSFYDKDSYISRFVRGELDPINPDYYTRGIETSKFILSKELGFAEGNIIKYIVRYKEKNGLEDLEKAQRYLDMLKEQYDV